MPTSVNGLHIGVKRRPALCYDDFNAKIRAQRSTASACRHPDDGGICMHVPTGAGANRDTRHRGHCHRRRSRRSPNVNTNAYSRTHCYTRYCGHGRCRSIGHHRRRAAHFDTFYYRPYSYSRQPPLRNPFPLEPAPDYSPLTAGGKHTCQLQADATVLCWGADDKGQSNPAGRRVPICQRRR